MTGAPFPLDMDKLRKVRALMTRGATAGERQAARTKAEAVATRAGMTLTEALSRLDAPAPASPANFFAGFDDWMEAKEPGWKAAEVRALLRSEPGLSDREIARRVGVSPQTVGNWRRRAA